MGKLREFRYRLFSWRKFDAIEPSKEKIDVVIPIIEKDLRILPLCLEGVRQCVAHTIKDIYIVARPSEAITAFCKEQGLIFVDECSVLGFGPKDLDIKVPQSDGTTRDRSGWLFQQLIKLSGRVGTCEHYLCIDADHVLIRPHIFLSDKGETVFYMSYEQHMPYYANIEKLVPGLTLDTLSYVDHKMLFSRKHLSELHQLLESNSGKSWIDVILENYDRTQIAGFSEFELYGNFVQTKLRRPWLQKRLPYSKLADYDTLRTKYQSGRWSLTFPDYMRQNQKPNNK